MHHCLFLAPLLRPRNSHNKPKLFNDRLRKGFYVVLARDKKRKFELIPIALLRTSPSVLKHEVCLYRRALNDRVCARGGSASS